MKAIYIHIYGDSDIQQLALGRLIPTAFIFRRQPSPYFASERSSYRRHHRCGWLYIALVGALGNWPAARAGADALPGERNYWG